MQRQQAVADQVGRGLVAGAEQQADIGLQLLGRQLVARLLGLHQFGREIVLRLAAAQLAELVEIDAGHLACSMLAWSSSSRVIGTGSRMRPLTLLPARNGARCSSGMPSMSQITITGRR